MYASLISEKHKVLIGSYEFPCFLEDYGGQMFDLQK